MGLNPHQLRDLVIRPTLQRLDLWSDEAEELVLGIAIQESDLRCIKQEGGGPANGLWQMEKVTHDDIWENFLKSRIKFGLKILGPYPKHDHNRLVWDLAYGCAMCRVHLLRCPGVLPLPGETNAQAKYWKKWYNTPLGKGTEAQYIANWHRVMGRA